MATGRRIKILIPSDIEEKATVTSVESLQLTAHEHANKETIDAINKAFTEALKAQYDNAAQLDETGTLMSTQIPSSLIAGLEWAGVLNVTTGSIPAAAEDNNGNFYKIGVGGTSSITGTSITFKAGDWIISNSTEWEHVPNSLDNASEDTPGLVKLAGDISGTYDNIKVTGIGNIDIDPTDPLDKQTMVFDADSGTLKWMDFSTTGTPDAPEGLSVNYNAIDWTNIGKPAAEYEFSINGGNTWNTPTSKPIIIDNYVSSNVPVNGFYLRVAATDSTPNSDSVVNDEIIYQTEEEGRVWEGYNSAIQRYSGTGSGAGLHNAPVGYIYLKNGFNQTPSYNCTVCYHNGDTINFRGTISVNGGWRKFSDSLITWPAIDSNSGFFTASLAGTNNLAPTSDFVLVEGGSWQGSSEDTSDNMYIIHPNSHDGLVNDDGKMACYGGNVESAWW